MEAFTSTLPEPPPSPRRKPRPAFLKVERFVCSAVRYFPLAFVYSLTTWSVYVEATVGLFHSRSSLFGKPLGVLGIVLYILLNFSYTVAVFTEPGSPLSSPSRRGNRTQNGHAYSHLPTTEHRENGQYSSLTVSSTGAPRYCKKCQAPKPDRAHHCSTCKRCVLKMDHHCPWLATCVGLYNYKPFLLFLIYTSLFCWVCLAVSSRWIWNEMLTDVIDVERALPVNVVMLAVIAVVIGLVLSGFTCWHISLAFRGITTIECLEKTRYLAPIRRTLDRQRQGPHHGQTHDGSFAQTLQGYGQQIIDMHANAIPGVTRAEEGEERPSPTPDDYPNPPLRRSYNPAERHDNYQTTAQQALYHSYEELERQRDFDRYQEYLDDRDSEKLPNAFDLGWRRNLAHLFGPNPFLWLLPICNTTGDGWHWDPSPKWLDVKQRIERQRVERFEAEERRQRELQSRYAQHHQQQNQQQFHYYQPQGYTPPQPWTSAPRSIPHPPAKAPQERPATGVSMQTLAPMSPRPRQDSGYSDDDGDRYSSSSDENAGERAALHPDPGTANGPTHGHGRGRVADDWRDWD